jgi:hypothetical protein
MHTSGPQVRPVVRAALAQWDYVIDRVGNTTATRAGDLAPKACGLEHSPALASVAGVPVAIPHAHQRATEMTRCPGLAYPPQMTPVPTAWRRRQSDHRLPLAWSGHGGPAR